MRLINPQFPISVAVVAPAIALSVLVVGCSQPSPTQSPLESTPVRVFSPAVYPPLAAGNEASTHFGVRVPDPYRQLENLSAPSSDRWIRAQDKFAEKFLKTIGLRRTLKRELTQLAASLDRVASVEYRGSSLFYLKQRASDSTWKLYVFDMETRQERLLVDPTALFGGDRIAAVDYAAPSPDGAYVAFGASVEGAEVSELRVLDVHASTVLPGRVPDTRYANISWAPDSRSFYYWRAPARTLNKEVSQSFTKMRVYQHRLGQAFERDQPVFGHGLAPGVGPDDFTSVIAGDASSSYILGRAKQGTEKSASFYVAKVPIQDGAHTWRRLTGPSDNALQAGLRGTRLYMLRQQRSANYELVSLDLTAPNGAPALVYSHPTAALRSFIIARDAVYVHMLDAGIGSIVRLDGETLRPTVVPVPGGRSVKSISGTPSVDGIGFLTMAWTHPPQLLHYSPRSRTTTDSGALPRSTASFAGIQTRRLSVEVPGAPFPVPITLIQSTKHAGSPRPTKLIAYGSYGYAISPQFEPTLLPWLRRGGIVAIAHVRGGGEHGLPWHEGGRRIRKQNAVDDLVACARHLIGLGFTTQRLLSLDGTSAGGVIVGAALTQHPDLFRAAVVRVGILNVLRFETTKIGPANIPEFGSVSNEKEFLALRQLDAYTNIQKGVSYPAVLLTAGMNDSRVPVWQPAKFAARLQAESTSGEPVLLRVAFSGGHGIRAAKEQRVEELSDEYAFLLSRLAGAAD